ncbi:MAG TPA: methyltransferase domain-containing protein [Thiobacillus sp.]|nr:methyltransferase domain-containing protein [Thiobacillus sp.]
MKALKTRLKAMWMAGDYGYFAKFLEPGAMEFFPRLGIVPGERVLDVACGAGQLSIPAARDGATVTGIDIATNLIEQARSRAENEGLAIRFEEGDAEDLPYDAAAFDVVFSLIGAMFAPRPERVAAELARVCRPGGRIVMGNWTPGGLVGQMFKTIGKHVPPPAIMPSPVLWGDEATVYERLGDRVADLRLTRKMYPMKYPFPPSEVVEFFRTYYGPTNRAFAALDPDKQAALRSDLEQLWSEHNQASDGRTEIEAEYLEVAAIRA